MTLPAPATKVYLDAGTDDPKQARTELADHIDKFNALLTHLGLSIITSEPLGVGANLENSGGNLRVKAASTTQDGAVELATDAEAIAQSDATRALTPANLAALGGSETVKGLIELATNAEALTGTDTARATTPANVKHVLDNRSGLPTQAPVRSSTTSYTAYTGSHTVPQDNTKPTTSETEAILAATASLTCLNTSNFLRFEGFVPYDAASSGDRFVVCVFRDAETTAYLTFPFKDAGNNNLEGVAFSAEIQVPDTSAHTYTLRAGTASGSAFYINGDNTGQFYNGTAQCYLKVSEIKA